MDGAGGEFLVGIAMWVFPKIGVPQNGWFIMETPIKNGWFGGTIIFGNIHIAITLPETNMNPWK